LKYHQFLCAAPSILDPPLSAGNPLTRFCCDLLAIGLWLSQVNRKLVGDLSPFDCRLVAVRLPTPLRWNCDSYLTQASARCRADPPPRVLSFGHSSAESGESAVSSQHAFLTTRGMLKWSNEVITWSNEAFWLDDIEIHDRRRACDLRENQTGLIFAQAIASSEFCRRKVILIANILQRHRTMWSTAATLSPACLRSISD
jgi:hypothetical protein